MWGLLQLPNMSIILVTFRDWRNESASCFHRPTVLTASPDLSQTTFITWPLYVPIFNGETRIILLVSQVSMSTHTLCPIFPEMSGYFLFLNVQSPEKMAEVPLGEGLTRRISIISIFHSIVESFPPGPGCLYNQQVLGLKMSSDLGTGQGIMTFFSIMTTYLHPLLLSLITYIRQYPCWLPINFSP